MDTCGYCRIELMSVFYGYITNTADHLQNCPARQGMIIAQVVGWGEPLPYSDLFYLREFIQFPELLIVLPTIINNKSNLTYMYYHKFLEEYDRILTRLYVTDWTSKMHQLTDKVIVKNNLIQTENNLQIITAAAVIALLNATYSGIDHEEIYQILLDTATKLDTFEI